MAINPEFQAALAAAQEFRANEAFVVPVTVGPSTLHFRFRRGHTAEALVQVEAISNLSKEQGSGNVTSLFSAYLTYLELMIDPSSLDDFRAAIETGVLMFEDLQVLGQTVVGQVVGRPTMPPPSSPTG